MQRSHGGESGLRVASAGSSRSDRRAVDQLDRELVAHLGRRRGSGSRYDLYENSALVASGTALSNGFTGKPDGTYRYQVQAFNAAGCGVRTPEFDVTALLPPGAPGALVGPSTSATGAYTLSWGAASGTVSRYNLYENGTLAYSAPGASAGLVGRTDGTYRYRVQACNALSCGAFGAEFDIAVAIPPNAPGAPGPITGPSSSTTGAFALGWGAASGVVSRYDLYENGVLIQSSPALTSSLSGRRDGSYHYRVQACNSGGCGLFTPELVVNVLLIPPAPAPIFASTATTTSGAFTIGWTAPSGYTVDGYRLERSYAGGAWTTINLGAVASYDDKQLVDGVYSYRVSARNASGVGPPAGPVSVTVSLQLSDALPDHPIVSPSVPGQQWLGTLAGRASVDGGEATYQIGIDVPPGRAGMEPTLGLTYKSRGGNGIAGVGWSLAGSSTIYRCPRTLEQDGAAAPVRLTSDNRLCFDGQRLVAATGSYGASGSEYRTEIDAFDRVTLQGGDMSSWSSYFEVEHKSGLISSFAPTRQNLSAGAPAPDAWRLVHQFDRQGNCMSFNYKLFSASNGGKDEEWVLNSIAYTGMQSGEQSTTGPDARQVTFEYSSNRPDKRTTFHAGVGSVLTARLGAIVTWVGSQAVRRYSSITWRALRPTAPSSRTRRSAPGQRAQQRSSRPPCSPTRRTRRTSPSST